MNIKNFINLKTYGKLFVLVISLIIIVFSFFQIAKGDPDAPDPGHTWSEIGDVLVTVLQGGTGVTSTADDAVWVGDSSSAVTARILPNCSNTTTDKLLYNNTTNSFSCGTDQTGSGDNIRINGVDATDANFNDSTPSAPAGGANIIWQKDNATPNNISAYITPAALMDAIRRKFFIFTDFLGPAGAATIESHIPFDFALINSGTQAKVAGEPHHPGILRITSSATANSGGYCLTDITAFRIAGGEVFEIIFQHLVSGGTNTTLRFGFLDTQSSADATDGVYFEVSAGSLNIVGKTANNSTRSTTATNYTLSINTWYRARLIVNANATRVDFYLYNDSGTQLWTDYLTTNIPTASGRETGAGLVVTNSGTTATNLMYVDWMAVWFDNRALTR